MPLLRNRILVLLTTMLRLTAGQHTNTAARTTSISCLTTQAGPVVACLKLPLQTTTSSPMNFCGRREDPAPCASRRIGKVPDLVYPPNPDDDFVAWPTLTLQKCDAFLTAARKAVVDVTEDSHSSASVHALGECVDWAWKAAEYGCSVSEPQGQERAAKHI